MGYEVGVIWEMTGRIGREMERGTKGGRTLTETLVGISGTGVMPWLVIFVVTGNLWRSFRWRHAQLGRTDGPLVRSWWQSGGQRMHSGCLLRFYKEQWW